MLRAHTVSDHPEVFFYWPHLTGGKSSHQQLILTPFPLRSSVAASPIKLISRDLVTIPYQFSDVPISTRIERGSLPNKVNLSIVLCELEAQYWPLCFEHLCYCVVFSDARRLLFTASILVANRSLRVLNITKLAAQRSKRAMLCGQYWILNKNCLFL